MFSKVQGRFLYILGALSITIAATAFINRKELGNIWWAAKLSKLYQQDDIDAFCKIANSFKDDQFKKVLSIELANGSKLIVQASSGRNSLIFAELLQRIEPKDLGQLLLTNDSSGQNAFSAAIEFDRIENIKNIFYYAREHLHDLTLNTALNHPELAFKLINILHDQPTHCMDALLTNQGYWGKTILHSLFANNFLDLAAHIFSIAKPESTKQALQLRDKMSLSPIDYLTQSHSYDYAQYIKQSINALFAKTTRAAPKQVELTKQNLEQLTPSKATVFDIGDEKSPALAVFDLDSDDETSNCSDASYYTARSFQDLEDEFQDTCSQITGSTLGDSSECEN